MRYVAPRTKRLDKRMIDHLARLLWPIVNERFEGNATRFAKDAKVSQSAIAQILKPGGGDRGVGIVVLLALRDYLGNVTLDDMLGLPPPRLSARQVAPASPGNTVEATVEAVLARLASQGVDVRAATPALPEPVRVSPRPKSSRLPR